MFKFASVSAALVIALVATTAHAEDKAKRPVVCAAESFQVVATKDGGRVGLCTAGKRPTIMTSWTDPVKLEGHSFVVGVR